MARRQYQATFWESVTEGEEPVMPTILEATRPSTRASAKHKQINFIDVGDAFVDEKEKERREREGARRSALKARKRIAHINIASPLSVMLLSLKAHGGHVQSQSHIKDLSHWIDSSSQPPTCLFEPGTANLGVVPSIKISEIINYDAYQ
ncbi:hypothetical protein BU15DRAFT_58681 [Melanogaster broomeanus]|nr:hypothetical protein BU15DRAFT_58681 [Melanogaster broomeanus]